MRAKRVCVSLSDDEINILYAAVRYRSEDIAAGGEDVGDGSEQLTTKLLKARRRVRAALQKDASNAR